MRILLRNEWIQILLAATVTAIAGEFKITPFSGEVFRIALGSSAFLLCLLLMRHLSYVTMGIVTGCTVMLFRTIGDAVASLGSFSLADSIQIHLSAALYYMAFAVGMSRIQGRLHELHPLLLGACFSLIDFLSNELELLARSIIFQFPYRFTDQWLLITLTAVVRSYFVVGLYSSIMVSQMRALHHEQQKRMEQMLGVSSGLYGEVFYLRKSMDAIEHITAKSHDLYCRVNDGELKGVSRTILEITQEIHEVKKDSQRILAGLLKLFDRETSSNMRLAEIIDFVIKSNRGYSQMLGKSVHFESDMATDYMTDHSIPLITVLNNLVSNAVEAIETQGRIRIRVLENEGGTVFVVSDNGTGISDQDKGIIFEPGFTTKFNHEGYAATGIGLSHVRDIVQAFKGKISLHASGYGSDTTFVVTLPVEALKKGA